MESLAHVRPLGCDFSLDVPDRSRGLYEAAGYEPYSSTLFGAACRWADTIVDIGAHVGYYTLLGATANESARVIAVEASPENSAVLKTNAARLSHSNLTLVDAAFGASSGSTVLQVTDASDNCGVTGHPVSPTRSTIAVPTITGDDLGLHASRRLAIKLDVEGHEPSALVGLEAAIDGPAETRLLVELDTTCLRGAGHEPDDVVDWLDQHGFRVFVIDEARRTWTELNAVTRWFDCLADGASGNLLCLPRSTAITVGAVLHSSALAGAERSHAEMVEDLTIDGFLFNSVIPAPDLGLEAVLHTAGSSVSLVEPGRWWVHLPTTPAAAAGALPAAETLVHAPVIDALRAVDPDVVMTNTGVIAHGATAASVLDKPHVWYLREFGDLDHDFVLPARAMELGTLIRCLSDGVLTNSAAVRDHFFPGNPTAATVIQPVPRRPIGAGPPASGEAPWTLGIVGGLQPGKGHADAIAAVALLHDRGRDVQLRCVGYGADEDRLRLELLADEAGVADLVSVTGFLDSGDAFAGLNAIAQTSRSEAYGRTPFEAAAVGLPVIYSDSGGPREYMEPGVTGLPYRSGDVASLARAIDALIDDPQLGERLVSGARARFEVLRTDVDRIERLRAVFSEAAKTSGRSPIRQMIGRLAGSLDHDGLRRQLLTEKRQLSEQLVACRSERDELLALAARLTSERDAANATASAALGAAHAEARARPEQAAATSARRSWRCAPLVQGTLNRLRRSRSGHSAEEATDGTG